MASGYPARHVTKLASWSWRINDCCDGANRIHLNPSRAPAREAPVSPLGRPSYRHSPRIFHIRLRDTAHTAR
eukprot:156485-Prorocentrum_minimum.AAC.3